MSTGKKRTPIQEAVIEMRKRLELTQQQLSEALGVVLPTVGRWESSRPPSGFSLARLYMYAQRFDNTRDLSEIFWQAAEAERRSVISRLPRSIPERALWQVRTMAQHRPEKMREPYLVVLRALLDAHAKLLGVTTWPEELFDEEINWDTTHYELKREIEREEEKSKKNKR
jgi:transcriptional regulator with XRE-family HTH domain